MAPDVSDIVRSEARRQGIQVRHQLAKSQHGDALRCLEGHDVLSGKTQHPSHGHAVPRVKERGKG
ncbi:hypothetical protein CAE01nite_07950 [Cellulomonas aerilata]|uniref:Uncharacterized protein n=1 Tax=Cellulomonas aerilata TaxID=515326 RepID=A0A512D9Z4_9CELL|nr:hypothetical protein CAE01nite_07950 [Cellulomonas aerilata]